MSCTYTQRYVCECTLNLATACVQRSDDVRSLHQHLGYGHTIHRRAPAPFWTNQLLCFLDSIQHHPHCCQLYCSAIGNLLSGNLIHHNSCSFLSFFLFSCWFFVAGHEKDRILYGLCITQGGVCDINEIIME